jgi:hypothetical protein
VTAIFAARRGKGRSASNRKAKAGILFTGISKS